MNFTDEELAAKIAVWKQEINEDTGKPFGLRLIADILEISYGKARHLDDKYNKVVDEVYDVLDHESRTHEYRPVKTYVWDLETTNLNTFMGQLTVASFLDLSTGDMHTRTLFDFEGTGAQKEVQLLLFCVDMLKDGDIFIGHNTIGFDLGFLRGRLAIHGVDVDLPKRQHWDTYQIARHGAKIRPQGYSLENLLDFFRIAVQKDKPSKHDWAASIILDEKAIKRIAVRCEADVIGTALLWGELRKYQHSWKGR